MDVIAPTLISGAQQGIHVGNGFAVEAEIDEIGAAEKVDMALEGCNFAAGNEQQLVEVWLQLAQVVVLGAGIVVGNGDEVESAARGGIDGEINGAGNHLACLAGALAIAVCGVHMQVAAKPCGAHAQGLAKNGGQIGDRAGTRKVDVNGVMRFNIWQGCWARRSEHSTRLGEWRRAGRTVSHP